MKKLQIEKKHDTFEEGQCGWHMESDEEDGSKWGCWGRQDHADSVKADFLSKHYLLSTSHGCFQLGAANRKVQNTNTIHDLIEIT